MCVIIAQPSGTYLSREVAKAAWQRNPDGGGFTYIDDDTDKPVVFKYMEFDKFWGHFERVRSDNRDRDFIVHFRIATHGAICLANVHPFPVDDYTVMAHNGIIHKMPNRDPNPALDRTDSQMFIDYVLTDMDDAWLDNYHLTKMVEDFIGGSKLAFLTSNPKLTKNLYILNKNKGEEFRGMWFSNFHGLQEFKPKPPAKAGKVQGAAWEKKKDGSWGPRDKPVTPVINKSQSDKDWEQMYLNKGKGVHDDWSEGSLYTKNAKQRAQEEVINERTFEALASLDADVYPPDWCQDPAEEGISPEESTHRWIQICEEISIVRDNREKVLGVKHDLGFDPKSLRIRCVQCEVEIDTDGWCLCVTGNVTPIKKEGATSQTTK